MKIFVSVPIFVNRITVRDYTKADWPIVSDKCFYRLIYVSLSDSHFPGNKACHLPVLSPGPKC